MNGRQARRQAKQVYNMLGLHSRYMISRSLIDAIGLVMAAYVTYLADQHAEADAAERVRSDGCIHVDLDKQAQDLGVTIDILMGLRRRAMELGIITKTEKGDGASGEYVLIDFERANDLMFDCEE